MKNPIPVAVLFSDLHLTLRPPAARCVDENWLDVQAGYLEQVEAIHEEAEKQAGFTVPLVCCGDLFDRHNPPVELVNWAIRNVPEMYAVPGNHDLKFHELKAIKKSAFWTMVEAGKVNYLRPGKPVGVGQAVLHGFPWGTPLKPCKSPHGLCVEIAVIHKYVWQKKGGNPPYPGAPEDGRASRVAKALRGYDLIASGDNHIPFEYMGDPAPIFNCGGFMRRKADERGHRPSVGIVHQDGSVVRRCLDVSADRFVVEVGEKMGNLDLGHFVEELVNLTDAAVDFADAVRRAVGDGKVSDGIRRTILDAMGEKK